MNNLLVRDAARDAMSSFLADVVNMIHWTPDISAFGITTKIQYYFPGLIDFLEECPVPKPECVAGEVDVERFLFHLEHLSVSYYILLASIFLVDFFLYTFILASRFSCCFCSIWSRSC